jgi:phage tail-like protein
MAILREQPYGNAQFTVEIDGLAEMAFDQVLLPEASVEVVEYREGGDRERASRKLPGLSKFSNIVLRRGYTGSLSLYEWMQEARQGEANTLRSVAVTLLDEERNPVTRWAFRNAFPVQHAFSLLDAMDGSTLVEQMELAFESAEME